jgi:uncharacterized membrane protein YbhN (UPF0104 family)
MPGGSAHWFGTVWDRISGIELRYIVLGCVLQGAQTVLNGICWRNILRASYPESDVPMRPIVAAYAAGIGLNEVLPAQAGTVAYLGLFRRVIPGSRMVTITAGAIAQNLFFTVLGAGVFAYLLISRPAGRDRIVSRFSGHLMFWFVIAAIVAGVIALVVRRYWNQVRRFWAHASAGAAILGEPMRYLREVAALQAVSYALRLGVNATFMYAAGIPVTVETVLLIAAAHSISGTLAVTPGGFGTQQALDSIVLHSVAPAAVVTACSLAQETIVMTFNVIFGLALLVAFLGISESRNVFAALREQPASS